MALERFAQQSDAYKKRAEAARLQQESLWKQIESLRRAGFNEDLAPAHVPFREGEPEVLPLEVAGARFGRPEAEPRHIDPFSPLSPQLQAERWLVRFASVKLPTFAGNSDPREFFMRYETAVESCGGGEAIKAKAFPMAAEGIAGAWYTRLPPGSISSWGQLRDQISVHFRGNHAKPVNSSGLHACVQREGESLTDYTRRFIHLKC